MNLYELTSQYSALYSSEVIEFSELAELKEELQQKALNIGYVVSNLESDLVEITAFIDKMKKRRDRIDLKIHRLKSYLVGNLVEANIYKIEGPHFSLTLKKNPLAVRITDEALIDKCYIKEKITYSFDRIAIKKAIEAGTEVLGASLKQVIRVEIS